ncbi:uncharacterized protein LOC110249594 [Exaiptasia diaphana]|uniref:UMOD/GP2/OIT3-like D8C domain-containing protein n=1 Tax=Exaiptasia diaphana TaxID=2652724 RepID=A0A913XYM3_EXADI|nr:uncharacterized protein LOC110249594 [Exaiptasia diaphana]KXJ07980.1 Uromodulin [Exaiptasia diaphana]
MMARTSLLLLLIMALKVSSDSLGIEKKDIQDKWPVLEKILEKLFLPRECIYYTKISSPTRSINYRDLDASQLCDARLPSGWYRFTQSAGDQMTTKCPIFRGEDLYCSSMSPGWMDGELPSIRDGRVQRKVCFHAENKCCQASVDIVVRNCGIFYVYYLVKVPCPFRYCGGQARITTTMTPTVPEQTTTPKPIPQPVSTAEPFPIEPGNVTTAEPSTLPPFPPLLHNISTSKRLTESTTTTGTLRTEPENTTTAEPFPTEEPEPDECSNYKTLVEIDRGASFYNPSEKKGDHTLQTNWYRFNEGAGNKMADRCVPVFHCGTHAPGWLLGGHPTNATRHPVIKDVCFNWQGNCCFFRGQILVRQCGDFFIYNLRKIRFKYLRYCGNGALIKH